MKYKLAIFLGAISLLALGCNKQQAATNQPLTQTSNTNASAENPQSTDMSNMNMAPSNTPAPSTTPPNSKPPTAPGTPVTHTPTPTPIRPTPVSMDISGFAFSKPNITVKVGTTVTWTNRDSVAHTVTGSSGGPNSPTLGTGESYSYNFESVGTFNYFCAIHPNMKGSVTVTE